MVVRAVQMAVWQRSANSEVILHSDRGGQFISGTYQKFLGGNANVAVSATYSRPFYTHTTGAPLNTPGYAWSCAPLGGGQQHEKHAAENGGQETSGVQFEPGNNTFDLARDYTDFVNRPVTTEYLEPFLAP